MRLVSAASAAVLAYLLWASRGWPLIHDAPLMHYIAWLIDQGGVPYRDAKVAARFSEEGQAAAREAELERARAAERAKQAKSKRSSARGKAAKSRKAARAKHGAKSKKKSKPRRRR